MLRPESIREHTDDFISFVEASPSSFHAAAEAARRLEEAGFSAVDETAAWDSTPGGHFVVRNGAIIAWKVPDGADAQRSFRIVGAHTDSPSFKLKPEPTFTNGGYQQVAVEVYGGPLLNSWLDRELGLAGRIATRDGVELVRTGPVMRIPQLAIHLDRGVNDTGLVLDKQAHTAPVFSLGAGRSVLGELADAAGVSEGDILGHDVVAYATELPGYFGADQEFLASGRMDNLTSVHAGLQALLDADGNDIAVLAAFDHEEVGSGTTSGASGPLLEDVLTRTALALGAGPDEVFAMLRRSSCVSSDAGHAVHPNYAGHRDPTHRPVLGGGPLLKINAQQRYASDAVGEALWRRACEAAEVDTQAFVSNNRLPCGSTIGPLTATRLGIDVVDVGTPLLSMHSAREMAACSDLLALTKALGAYYAGA